MHDIERSADDAGFTLVELLICIVLLGILGGIAIFVADSAQDQARGACQVTNDRTDATRDGVVAVRGGARPDLVAGGTC